MTCERKPGDEKKVKVKTGDKKEGEDRKKGDEKEGEDRKTGRKETRRKVKTGKQETRRKVKTGDEKEGEGEDIGRGGNDGQPRTWADDAKGNKTKRQRL